MRFVVFFIILFIFVFQNIPSVFAQACGTKYYSCVGGDNPRCSETNISTDGDSGNTGNSCSTLGHISYGVQCSFTPCGGYDWRCWDVICTCTSNACAPYCGDRTCDFNEDACSCPSDCTQTRCEPSATPTPYVNDRDIPQPTAIPTATPRPSATVTPNPSSTPQPTATPTPRPLVQINYNIFLHGLGNSGDNANPNANSLSNKNPRRKDRAVSIEVLDSANRRIAIATSRMQYASESGSFTGSADLGTDITQGNYIVTLKSDQYLRNAFPGIQLLTPGQTVSLPAMTLVTGDVVTDNQLNILDYNILYGCYTGTIITRARACTTEQKNMADLTDEGTVNHYDYNLFIRELSVQGGR